MNQARQLFNDGEANPLSDVGLVNTQEDIVRRPMLNHIALKKSRITGNR